MILSSSEYVGSSIVKHEYKIEIQEIVDEITKLNHEKKNIYSYLTQEYNLSPSILSNVFNISGAHIQFCAEGMAEVALLSAYMPDNFSVTGTVTACAKRRVDEFRLFSAGLFLYVLHYTGPFLSLPHFFRKNKIDLAYARHVRNVFRTRSLYRSAPIVFRILKRC